MLDALLKSLAIDPVVLALNAGTFIVLLLLMNVVFWRPMTRHLNARKARIADAHKVVEETRREMDALRIEYEERIAGVEADARERIQQTVRIAQEAREAALAQARADAEVITQEGRVAIEQEHLKTLEVSRSAIDEVALLAVSRALGSPADAAQRDLVDEYTAAVASGSR